MRKERKRSDSGDHKKRKRDRKEKHHKKHSKKGRKRSSSVTSEEANKSESESEGDVGPIIPEGFYEQLELRDDRIREAAEI